MHNRNIKFLFVVAMSVLFFTGLSAQSYAANEEKASKFVQKIADDGIAFLTDKNLSEDQKREEFRALLTKNFALDSIGKFALGRYWRVASPQEKKEYQALFEKMIVDVYAKRFGDYQDQKIEITGARPDGAKDVIVKSKVVNEKGTDISVDWRVREGSSGQMKVIDVIVEGVSMAVTQRSDFAAVIQRGGGEVSVLLAELK